MDCGANCPVTDIRVYPGLTNQSIANHPYYTVSQYFIHPDYPLNRWDTYDLGLIRLNTDIPLDGTSGSTGINAICLPEEMATNWDEEYALMVGFGYDNENGTGSGVHRLGWTKIMKSGTDPNNTLQINYVMSFKRIPFPSGASVCNVENSGQHFYSRHPDPSGTGPPVTVIRRRVSS
ncbi:unnamed protein product [Medioppia subpectinata]|uniref:Peptidase S1 domain-containing protein n=1 Tax=Medioppia subpectinata TaxID=1979941 RepID=A0A7R9KDV3_9ACAR|nr:unnamed protein product [Medioppia subpectinata]CAG2101506.1 unnamed protein product [Medioppia subpectinata]